MPTLAQALTLAAVPVFTPESAAIAGQRGRDAMKASRERHAANLAAVNDGSAFTAETLARVRECLTDTLLRLASAKDAKDRELLSRAVSHLAETERKLSGRPLPGTRRPGNEAPPPPSALPEPL